MSVKTDISTISHPSTGNKEVLLVARPHIETGISLASMIPESLGNASNVCWWAIEFGYQFFQTLPLRGIVGNEWFCGEEYSRDKENAWNPVDSIWDGVFHRLGGDFKPAKLHDGILFPDQFTCDIVFDKLAGREVAHDFESVSDGKLLEINPGIGVSATKIVKRAENEGIELVSDTAHLFDPFVSNFPFDFGKPKWPMGSTYGELLATIPVFAPHIRAVHLKGLNLHHAEVVRCLLACPNLKPEIDVIAEYKPNPFAKYDEVLRTMQKFLHNSKNLFQVS